MQEIEIRCKGCGKKLLKYSQSSFRKYGSPLKNCKKCGRRYADPRYHEIAIEGVPKDTFSISSYLILMLLGAFLLYRGIHLFRMYQLGVPSGMQFLLPTVFALGGIILVFGGIWEIITIVTGIKAKRFDKLRVESEMRLMNRSYAYSLQDFGYPVPEKYFE